MPAEFPLKEAININNNVVGCSQLLHKGDFFPEILLIGGEGCLPDNELYIIKAANLCEFGQKDDPWLNVSVIVAFLMC